MFILLHRIAKTLLALACILVIVAVVGKLYEHRNFF